MSTAEQLGEALKREVGEACERSVFGEAAIRAIRAVVPAERLGKLDGLDATMLGFALFCHISTFNNILLKAANVHGVRSNEYGDLMNAAPPYKVRHDIAAPAGFKSILKPEGVTAYLIQRLISTGALPVPATPIEDIIVSLAPPQEDAVTDVTNPALQDRVRKLAGLIPGLRAMDSRELGLMVSGEGLVNECVRAVCDYALEHLDELDDLIREIWHAGSVCFDDFLVNEERGGRAGLFTQVRNDLIKKDPLRGGDDHPISISMRGEEFKRQILPLLLQFRNPLAPLSF